jgi:cell division septum initiation protein DivIVA
MSVFEPHTKAEFAAGIEIDPPEFPIVVRGYDRQRVNAYVQNVVSRLAAEHDRATQAEQAAANHQPPTFEHLGAEAMKVLELASRSADKLVEQAKERGGAIIQEAEGQAADLLEEAKQQAERLHAAARGTLREAADERDRILADASEGGKQIRSLAEDDARAMLEEAESASQRMWQTVRDECTVMQVETERLRKLRDRTMEHLSYVRTELNSSLFAEPEEEDPDPDLTAEAAANAGPEPDASADSADDPAEPDSAPAVQPESDQEGGPKARRGVSPRS